MILKPLPLDLESSDLTTKPLLDGLIWVCPSVPGHTYMNGLNHIDVFIYA